MIMPEVKVSKKHLNELNGSKWLLYSKSVWDDIITTSSEKTDHPAQFPISLVSRLLHIFTKRNDLVLDPFLGSGTTLVACRALKRFGVGVELNPDYVKLTKSRLSFQTLDAATEQLALCADSRHLLMLDELREFMGRVGKECIDFMVTSPPYWDVLHETHKKTVLPREKQPSQYSELNDDLGNILNYGDFILSLKEIFKAVYKILCPERYCAVITMDIRKGNRIYPLHSDIVRIMNEIGFSYQDVIIWNRNREYNYLRPMGYPTTFIVNRIHEYISIFRKQA